ncbi:DUF1592 domain-containing protein [Lentisphaera marina]|nr:DUF1592 domain-containing protein [Lentisphaera marina]MDD7985122.1 DUF1592 domain-containing protein [Lentisphaera marina]
MIKFVLPLVFGLSLYAEKPQAILPEKHFDFLANYCLNCHDEEKQEGKVNLEDLPFHIQTIEQAEQWQGVLAAINAGDMPPEDKKQPKSHEKADFLEGLSNTMVTARKVLSDSGGKITMRRLNKREYSNTLKDLLGVTLQKDTLPSDDNTEDFDTVGAAQFISGDKFEQYLKLGRQALDNFYEAQEAKKVKPFTYRVEAEKVLGEPLKKRVAGFADKEKRLASFKIAVDKALQTPENQKYVSKLRPNDKNNPANFYRKIAGLKGMPKASDFGFKSFAWAGKTIKSLKDDSNYYKHYASLPHNDIGAYFQLNFGSTKIVLNPGKALPVGKYKVRVRAGAVEGATGYRHFLDLGYQAEKDIGRGQFSGYPLRTLHVPGTPDKPRIIETSVEIHSHSKRVLAIRERQSDWGELRKFYYYPLRNKNGYGHPPATWVDWVEIEGPIAQKDESKLAYILAKHAPIKNDLERARKIINDFSLVAYRYKKPRPEFINGLMELFQDRLKKEKEFDVAIRTPLSIILASPRFIYMREPGVEGEARKLNERELAIRLSYFLWSSPPDATLISLAKAGKLKQNLSQQVERMLRDPKARNFVDGLAHQWLDMKRLDFFQFGLRYYREFDQSARNASREEVYQTMLHLLRSNEEGQLNMLLKSDFVVVNAMLANIYGIEGVEGDEFRRVQLKEDSPRGGLMGMVAINAMGSDGVESSPVERGAWALRHVLNDPPPPAPANVPMLNRIGGKMTKREKLIAHQEEPQCASCHRKIDPIGFGLENFDAIGRWRKTDPHVRSAKNKQGIIDASGAFYKGSSFANFMELRDQLNDKKDSFARGFAEALVEYSLGRPYAFTDEEMVDNLLAVVKKRDYQMSSFVKAIVHTRQFQSK